MMDVSHVPQILEIAQKRLPLLYKAFSGHSKSTKELWIFENLQVMSGVDVSEHDQFYNQLYLPHCWCASREYEYLLSLESWENFE